MGAWFQHEIIEHRRLALFCFLCAFMLAFAFIRFSVRMIRAEVRWWPGNVESGGVHVHHVVFGVVLMVIGGVALTAVPVGPMAPRAVAASIFGVGTALVLDEFALILHLRDVYWSKEGRASVDAVFVAAAATGLLLLGFRPLGLADWDQYRTDRTPLNLLAISLYFVVQLGFAAITLAKGKIWTGLLGLIVPIFLLFGALRLSRPNAPWARWRYRTKPGRMARAVRREQRWTQPAARALSRFQDFVSGRVDPPESDPADPEPAERAASASEEPDPEGPTEDGTGPAERV
jgi:hypothetical protein